MALLSFPSSLSNVSVLTRQLGRVRATHEERTRARPGDDRIVGAIDTSTHAATIRRPPRDVWPWIVCARGGPGYRFLGLPLPVTKLAVRLVHFVMQRKQLLGIRRRAETPPLRGPAGAGPGTMRNSHAA